MWDLGRDEIESDGMFTCDIDIEKWYCNGKVVQRGAPRIEKG